MSANHDHNHSTLGDGLKIAFFLNLAFTLLEVAGGFWTNSIAILSDALHDFGDSFSLGLAWYLERLSARRADARFTYGYRRFSTLGALITGLVLLVGLGFVLWSAFQRLQAPEPVHVPGMLGLAVLGVLFNGLAVWKIHGGDSLNERLVHWHLLEDTLGWVAVLLGAVVMWIWDVPVVDPILSLGIALVILWNVFRNLQRVGLVFLQSAPSGFDRRAFDEVLADLPGVLRTHHTHTWTLDGERHVFSTHVVMEEQTSREDIVDLKRKVHELLFAQAFDHITVEVELAGEDCSAGPGGCG